MHVSVGMPEAWRRPPPVDQLATPPGVRGLGVAIDYSLLVVSRWREERAAGRDNVAAVTEAMNHAG